MHTPMQDTQTMNTQTKETNKVPVTDSKEVYIYKLLDKEFKIIIKTQ